MEASPMDAGPIRGRPKGKGRVDDSGYATFTPSSSDVDVDLTPADRSRLADVFGSIRLGGKSSLRRQDAIVEEMETGTIASSSLLHPPDGDPCASPFDSAIKYSPIFRPSERFEEPDSSPRSSVPPSRSAAKRRFDFGRDPSHATPTKSSSEDGRRKTLKDARKIKRLIYRRTSAPQKIGTPEKNRLLYSEIKKVTPPRRPPTPPKAPSPKRPTGTVGRLVGSPRVDFLKLLDGHRPALERLFAHLSDEDLHNASRVSRAWRKACSEDPRANRRRKKFADRLERNKENANPLSEGKKTEVKRGPARENRGPGDVQNKWNVMAEKKPTLERSPPASPRSRNHRKFVKAASLGSTLRGCISCGDPAILNGRWATCQHLSCGTVFCGRCRYDKDHCERFGCKTLEPASPNRISPAKVIKKGKSMRKSLRRVLKFDNN